MGQKSRWVLPRIIHPTTYRRFTICVPDEQFYIGAFQGLLIELTYSKNWQRDNGHTAAIVSRVWQDILENVTCEQECPQAITEMEYEMSICEQLRFHNGKLQGYCCGEWVDIAGQGTVLPGDTPPQPPIGGGCQVYHGHFNASAQFLIPVPVSTGDTINVTDIKGSSSDNGIAWRCPNGQVYFAGACVGSTYTDGGDPNPALPHQSVVIKLGSSYYAATGGIFTVPGGVSNVQPVLQVNYPTLGDLSGDFDATFEVCNNQTASWCHYFDFQLSPQGFTLYVPPSLDSGDTGTWTPGVGFVFGDWHQTSPEWFRGAYIILTGITAFDLTGIDVLGDVTKGTFNLTTDYGVLAGPDVSGAFTPVVSQQNPAVSDGSGQTWSANGSVSAADTLRALIICASSTPGNTLSGNAVIKGLRVRGTGTNPFGSSNC